MTYFVLIGTKSSLIQSECWLKLNSLDVKNAYIQMSQVYAYANDANSIYLL